MIRSVIHAESGGDPTAASKVTAENIHRFPGKKIGDNIAEGLMQLRPETFSGLNVGSDIWNPKQNIMAGTKYLDQLLKRYHGDISLAAAAYNAGPGNVDKAGGIPNFAETQNYVKKVKAGYHESGGQSLVINNYITGYGKNDGHKIANDVKISLQSATVTAGQW